MDGDAEEAVQSIGSLMKLTVKDFRYSGTHQIKFASFLFAHNMRGAFALHFCSPFFAKNM